MKALRSIFVAAVALSACADPAGKSEPEDVVDATSRNLDWEKVAAEFAQVETIAGVGRDLEGGENGWDPASEGGPATSAQLSRPHMAQADAQGIIYIADKEAHAIRAIGLDGTITTVAGTGTAGDDGDDLAPARERRLSIPNGIWVREDGGFYIFDLGNDKVRAVDTEGNMRTLFAIGGSGAGRGLWVAEDESRALLTAGTSLKEWTPAGGVRVLASGFVSLGNLAVTESGDALLTDRGGHKVYRVSPSGERSVIAGNGTRSGGGDGQPALATGLDEVRGVWPYGDGLFLATHKGGDVWYMDASGLMHLFVEGDTDDETHAGDGQNYDAPGKKISEPRSVSVTPSGEILIVENDRGFVRRVKRSE